MSTGQPQEHQDLRWPYTQPDDVWPQDGDQNQPVQQASPQPGHPASQQASPQLAQQPAQQPAQQAWDGGATNHEDGWKPDPGDLPGSEDDEDYEWIRYLGGGRSARANPPAAPSRRPARPARGKPERGRRGSRSPEPKDRVTQRPAEAPGDADPGSGPREYADPGDGQPGVAPPGDVSARHAPPGAAPPGDVSARHAPPGVARAGVARAPSRPSRRELKAREQEQREQKDLQQKLLEQERREQRAREQKAREQQEREHRAREQQEREHKAREQQRREQEARDLDQSERQQRERDAREQAAREQAERRQDERERKAREQAQRKQTPGKQRPGKQEPRRQEPRKQEPRRQERSQPPKSPAAKPAQPPKSPAGKPVRPAPRGRSSRRPRRSMARRILWLTAGVLVVVVAVAVAVAKYVARSGSGTAHILVTPPRLGRYARDPALAGAMDAEALRAGIVRRSSGEAKNVVDAVYQDTTGPAAKAGPQILLFIGGNLSGASANAFITSFTGKLTGAVNASPGSLGGQAACVPSVQGRLAECAWADNDTFGVIASPTLSAEALAGELRQMRPLVERVAR